MKDLIVVATLTAKPGHEAALKAALEKIVPPSRAEAGARVTSCTAISNSRDGL